MHILTISIIFFRGLIKKRHEAVLQNDGSGRHTSITEEAFNERVPVLREITHKSMFVSPSLVPRGRWGTVRHHFFPMIYFHDIYRLSVSNRTRLKQDMSFVCDIDIVPVRR